MLETLQTALAANPVFSGGLMLGIFGLLAMWLREVPGKLMSWARQFFVVTLSFDSRDELMFTTLVEYMHAQDALRGSHNFTVRAVRQGPAYQNLADELQQGGRPEAYLSPGEGFHIFRLDGHWMWMQREVQVAANVIEKITLSMFGRDRQPMERFVQDALEHRMARELNQVAIYIPSPYTNEWQRARLSNNRRLDSIVLKAGQTESILADLKTFFTSRLRYENLGIPWRRGYLLYGPPGTGKTSLVTALASELALNVCSLSLASPTVTDEKIGNLLSTVPPRSVILIEDIDSFFHARDKADSQVKVSYSGFINALDGVAAHEGSVVFLTTNHPELIDEAAIRSGRVDLRLELSLCDRHQLYWMFRKFFDDEVAASRFADALPPGRYAPATLQEKLLKARDASAALAAFGLAP